MLVSRDDLRTELLTLAEEDQRVRAELAASGELFRGYHPRMAETHRTNTARLMAICDEVGWPTAALVGENGAHAAWLILQHSIGDPQAMRRGLALVSEAAEYEAVPPLQVAMLEDRVRMLSGLPQRFGSQLHWDEVSDLNPWPIEDPDSVDERRQMVGLGPLTEAVQSMREQTSGAAQLTPAEAQAQRLEAEAWARSVGWRD